MRKGKQSSIAKHRQVLPIRKARVGECIRRTGNVDIRYCCKVEHRAHNGELVGQTYYPLEASLRQVQGLDPLPIVFHEVVSETGEVFAYPQSLEPDLTIPSDWQECERELFSYGLQLWAGIYHNCEQGARWVADWELDPGIDVTPSQDFRGKLDAALANNVISTLEHPIVQILCSRWGDIEDPQLPVDWAEVS